MKKQLSLFFFLSLIIISVCLIGGCSKKAQPYRACIGTITTPSTVGALLTFKSCTSDASSYTWNFGDGNTATGDSVLHTYTATGTYKGSLTVSNGINTSTSDFSITIVPTGWTFEGSSFSIDSTIASQPLSTLTATGTAGSNTASLIAKLFPFPTVSGTYNYLVINATSGSSAKYQLFVLMNSDSAGIHSSYGSTGSDSVYAAVAVSGGKISVSIPAIEMFNLNHFSDSSSLSATITQTR